MTQKSQKPIKQCEGCQLNLNDRCAAFTYPHEQWHGQDCKGYNDPELITKYLTNSDGQGAHQRKEVRREKAKYNDTIEHKEGNAKFNKYK